MQTVTYGQLTNIFYGPIQIERRYSNIPLSDKRTYSESAGATPIFPMVHPYDFHSFDTKGQWLEWDLEEHTHLNEHYMPALVVPYVDYANTLGMQDDPMEYLKFLRLINSAGPSAKTTWDENKKAWRNNVTGDENVWVRYPVWTLDRFKETILSDALGQAFTILDISNITDKGLLEWAYKRALNRIPTIKSRIGEDDIVYKINEKFKDETYAKDYDKRPIIVSIPVPVQTELKKAADDAAVIIRENIDKLAVRAIEATVAESEGRELTFAGPEWLNPLAKKNFTLNEFKIQKQYASVPMNTDPVNSSGQSYVSPVTNIQSETKKSNIAIPAIASAAVIGTILALR